jgi:hypothetical protein
MSPRWSGIVTLAGALAGIGCAGTAAPPPTSPPKAEDETAVVSSPQAAARTYAQNYKDMILALCLAKAYKGEAAGADASSSFSALRDWTYYDIENSPDAIKALVERYLARDYHNPLADAEAMGTKFDLLKCLDLYHSPALEAQMRQFVPDPDRTYRRDNEPPAASR